MSEQLATLELRAARLREEVQQLEAELAVLEAQALRDEAAERAAKDAEVVELSRLPDLRAELRRLKGG